MKSNEGVQLLRKIRGFVGWVRAYSLCFSFLLWLLTATPNGEIAFLLKRKYFRECSRCVCQIVLPKRKHESTKKTYLTGFAVAWFRCCWFTHTLAEREERRGRRYGIELEVSMVDCLCTLFPIVDSKAAAQTTLRERKREGEVSARVTNKVWTLLSLSSVFPPSRWSTDVLLKQISNNGCKQKRTLVVWLFVCLFVCWLCFCREPLLFDSPLHTTFSVSLTLSLRASTLRSFSPSIIAGRAEWEYSSLFSTTCFSFSLSLCVCVVASICGAHHITTHGNIQKGRRCLDKEGGLLFILPSPHPPISHSTGTYVGSLKLSSSSPYTADFGPSFFLHVATRYLLGLYLLATNRHRYHVFLLYGNITLSMLFVLLLTFTDDICYVFFLANKTVEAVYCPAVIAFLHAWK